MLRNPESEDRPTPPFSPLEPLELDAVSKEVANTNRTRSGRARPRNRIGTEGTDHSV